MILFRCIPDGGEPFHVEADSRDVFAWEQVDKRRHLGMIQSTPKMGDLGELCWHACQRTNRWTGELGEFRRVVAFEPVDRATFDDGNDALDPTRPEA